MYLSFFPHEEKFGLVVKKGIEKYASSLRSHYYISLTSEAIFGSKDPKGREFDDESLMAAQSG